MISENTKKDLFWYSLALLVAALHLGTAYFIVLPRDLGSLYGLCFLAVGSLMWHHHEESGLGPFPVMIAAIIPIGHGYINLEVTGWTAMKELLLIYGLGFGPVFLIWIGKKTRNRFYPEEERI